MLRGTRAVFGFGYEGCCIDIYIREKLVRHIGQFLSHVSFLL